MRAFFIAAGSIAVVLIAGALTVLSINYFDKDDGDNAQQVVSTPEVSTNTVVSGLSHPWDIDFLPDGTLLFTERSGDISKVVDGTKVIIETPADIEANGEGGLTGLAVDADFADNRYIYTCFNTARGDIRVVRWEVDQGVSTLTNRQDIVTGIEASASGRHSGCQLAVGPDKNLWIGTGDAADETQPQDQAKLGGKILRVTRDGQPVIDNVDGPDKRVYSYGHRNTQAIAFYSEKQGESFGVSVEHGPQRDDEVNQLQPGNFGWAPGEGYDESVPMTDTKRFSEAIESVWSSGEPTIAPSGATFLSGASWGRLEGWLAMSVLKDQKLVLLNIRDGKVNGTRELYENEFGRLRAATMGKDNALYVSTDNGTNDQIIKITPTAKSNS